MKERIIVAAVFVPILLVIVFFLPPYVFVGLVALICAVSAYELLHAIGAKGNERITIYAVFSAALIPIGIYFDVGLHAFMAVFLVLLSFVFIETAAVFRTKREISFAQVMTSMFGGALIPLLLSSLVGLKNMPEGRLFVLLPVVSAFITDAGAYFSGMLFGKKKAFPLISPKKTVEGCVGGLVVGTAALMIYGVILVFSTVYEIKFWALLIYGIVGGVATILGDLAFSMVKREFNVKDYGRLLPGHGGMLDRFDSMVFTAPAIYLMVTVIPAIIVI
ncbi:MAG: phosphatidate cytidylyltransferase [Oscillospiraceae bacterium]|nr:phosphatidate cytidylyltransferase [Oscillospiraceae bacterium]